MTCCIQSVPRLWLISVIGSGVRVVERYRNSHYGYIPNTSLGCEKTAAKTVDDDNDDDDDDDDDKDDNKNRPTNNI